MDIKARGFVLTPAMAAAVRRNASTLAARVGERSLQLQVRLFDANSSRGGIDKGCLVVARIGRRKRIAVASRLHSDLYQAIPNAFNRLLRAVLAATHREHTLRRRVFARSEHGHFN